MTATPVAVGGGGGSGTRVVAAILRECGYYIGSDLNPALDNLWWTLLFKRPNWYRSIRTTRPQDIHEHLEFFNDLMTGRLRMNRRRWRLLLGAVGPMVVAGQGRGHGRGLWPARRAASILRAPELEQAGAGRWGWKEPNTHVLLDYLIKHFANLRYVHVMRHGLDMAFSRNQAQLYNWGWLFDVPRPTPATEPVESLRYWVRSNRRVLDLCSSELSGRHLVVNFDALCARPGEEVSKILSFLEVERSDELIRRLSGIPKTPSSSGRYREHDLAVFDPSDIDAVGSYGFHVDTTGATSDQLKS